MIKLAIKNHNAVLTEKLQKCEHYHLKKLINKSLLQVKKYYILIKAE